MLSVGQVPFPAICSVGTADDGAVGANANQDDIWGFPGARNGDAGRQIRSRASVERGSRTPLRR